MGPIEGFTSADAKKIVEQVATGKADQWKVPDSEMKVFKDILEKENRLMRDVAGLQIQLTEVSNKALAARSERDNLCKSLEQSLNIPQGTVWTIDLDAGLIKKK